MLASILHLGLNLWIQPAAFREMRATLSDVSTDLAASLVREGQFMHLSDGLTTFAREVNGSQMTDLLIADSRNPNEVSTYIAKKGYIAELEGIPAIVMTDGHVEQLNANGVRNMVRFDQSTFDLAPFVTDQKSVILKESDRYLPELFFPDMTNFYDHANRQRLLAEGHARIAAPLLDIAMALMAVYAVLGGDFSRRGYSMRIAIASAAAVALRLAAFGAASAAVDDTAYNALQYGLPIASIALISLLHFLKPTHGKRLPGSGRRTAEIGWRNGCGKTRLMVIAGRIQRYIFREALMGFLLVLGIIMLGDRAGRRCRTDARRRHTSVNRHRHGVFPYSVENAGAGVRSAALRHAGRIDPHILAAQPPQRNSRYPRRRRICVEIPRPCHRPCADPRRPDGDRARPARHATQLRFRDRTNTHSQLGKLQDKFGQAAKASGSARATQTPARAAAPPRRQQPGRPGDHQRQARGRPR